MRGRVGGVLTVLLLAPVTAELLQAYLGDLGGLVGAVSLVLFLAPMYGGAALLVREVSVRTGRGWRGRLLLAAAFGVAMPTVVDLSLFTPVRTDVDGWHAILTAAGLGGIGWSAVLTWVGGHVLMSVSTPVVVGESLARTPGPWLGRTGTAVAGLGLLGVATLVHRDQVGSYDTEAGPLQYAVSAVVVVGLVAAALSPLGAPLPRRRGPAPPVAVCFGAGMVLMAGFDLSPASWAGVALSAGVLGLGGVLVARWARTPSWSQRHLAALTAGALLTRTLTGFLAPLPPATTPGEKLVQNLTSLVLVLLLA